MVPRPSSAGSLSKFEEALRFLEEVRGAFEPREDVEALEEAARNRQAARAALAACRADLRAATQRLARALGDAEARVRMLGDGAVAESELAELAARCADLERQARACGDAAERARGDWLQLDAEARAAEDSELRADVAHARTLPELRAVVMLLAAATNALFEADGTVCSLCRVFHPPAPFPFLCACVRVRVLFTRFDCRCAVCRGRGHGAGRCAERAAGCRAERGRGGRAVGGDRGYVPQHTRSRRLRGEWP